MKKILIATVAAFALHVHAYAEVLPFSQGRDGRITQLNYHPADVFRINAKAGIATNIVLESDEVYLTHAFGDSDAWLFSTYGNHVFIKPKVELGDTNLVLITNKRTYNFYIKYTKNIETFQIRFNYPDTDAKALAQSQRSEVLDDVFRGKSFNLDYDARGDFSIKPINVWDDGTFTYFKFSGNTDLPAIYAVLNSEDGDESIVNRTVMGQSNNVIVMHRVNPLWKLRLGNAVLKVYNNSMNWVGVDNKTGTISPDVERVLVGGNENE